MLLHQFSGFKIQKLSQRIYFFLLCPLCSICHLVLRSATTFLLVFSVSYQFYFFYFSSWQVVQVFITSYRDIHRHFFARILLYPPSLVPGLISLKSTILLPCTHALLFMTLPSTNSYACLLMPFLICCQQRLATFLFYFFIQFNLSQEVALLYSRKYT